MVLWGMSRDLFGQYLMSVGKHEKARVQFKQAYDSIIKERESEAKLIRAREEREKAERVSLILHLSARIFTFILF